MAESEDHIKYRTHSQRHLKRLKNESIIAFAKEILNTLLENTKKNLNITSKHLKSSHLKNGETHLTIICYLLKSDFYTCLDITRQKKENAIATFTRNSISVLSKNYIPQRIITSLLSNPFSQY